MDPIQEQVPIIILLGTGGILLLIGAIALFILTYQKRVIREEQMRAEQAIEFQNKMIRLQLESAEREKKRIGANLHDSVGSLLWGIKVNASVIGKSFFNDNAEISAAIKDLNELVDEGIESVRSIAWELTPESFYHVGLSGAVNKLCQRFDTPDMRVVLSEQNSKSWNDDDAIQVFRIVQELVSNAVKHSEASQVEVSMIWEEKMLSICVSDNGLGFDNTIPSSGIGLWNVRQRIGQLMGTINIGHPPTGAGVEIKATIPL